MKLTANKLMACWLSLALPTVAADEPHAWLVPVLLPESASAWTGIGDGQQLVHSELAATCTEAHAKLCEDSLSSAIDGTFTEITLPDGTNATHVATGDIGDMWIRDSTEQLTAILQHAEIKPDSTTPEMRRALVGALRAQAFFILEDPYANSFRSSRVDSASLTKSDRGLRRVGWVATGNYELDSSGYFLRYMMDVAERCEELQLNPKDLLDAGGLAHSAAKLVLKTWATERSHTAKSSYTYPELSNHGKGAPVKDDIGLIWTGFGPSDNRYLHGYMISSNVFVAVVLERLVTFATKVWKDEAMADLAADLAAGIKKGLQAHGKAKGGHYCFTVDGLGGCEEMDDANLPSLLSLPLLDPDQSIVEIDATILTRQRVLSKKNPYYNCGRRPETSEVCGIGSPHTQTEIPNGIWPMSVIVQRATAEDADEREACLATLLTSAKAGGDILHESFDPDSPMHWTRANFAWVDSLFARFACDECWDGIGGVVSNASARVDRLRRYAGMRHGDAASFQVGSRSWRWLGLGRP